MSARRKPAPAGAGAMARHLRDRAGGDQELAALREQLAIARHLARALWTGLNARRGHELEAIELFSVEAARIADPVFDAAETIWERQRVFIEPSFRILDAQEAPLGFIGTWPGGEVRHLSRAQVLMMAGMDCTL